MRSEHFAFTFVPLCFVEWFGICFFGGEVFDLLMGLKFRVFLDFMELWGVCEGGVVGLFVFTENAESTFPFHILVSLVRGTVREYDSFFQVRSYFLKSERFGSFVLKPELWNCLNCEFFLNRRFLGILDFWNYDFFWHHVLFGIMGFLELWVFVIIYFLWNYVGC